LTETNLFEADFILNDSDILNRYIPLDATLLCGIDNITFFDPNQYFKTSIVLSKPLNNNDICDSGGYAYYGIADSHLFTSNIVLDKYGNINSKTLNDNAFSSIVTEYSLFTEDIANYENNVKKYQSFTKSNIYSDSGYVQYITHDNVDTIIIPTTLKENYKVGDILYFYLDEKDKNKDNHIDYMVVITENMLKCTKKQLIKYA